MITAAAKEFDENKLRPQVIEIQKAMASYMSGIPYTYGQATYQIAWPWVQNYRVYSTSLGSLDTGASSAVPPWMFNWIDATKKT